MKLLVFSDNHIGEYIEGYTDNKTGLNTRLIDTLTVWEWIKQLALEHAVDAIVFAGDRFKPHRPPSWMRDLADDRLRDIGESGLRIACLLGNHDMWNKSGKWNSYGGVKTWNRSSNVLVFDKPDSVSLEDFNLCFLPYGYRKGWDGDDLKNKNNILFFHDEISNLSNYGQFIAKGGIPKEELDRPEYLVVLGGHVHLRQRLQFHHTQAYHIGTPLERIEDGDQGAKGALLITVGDTVTIGFIESPFPKIKRISFNYDQINWGDLCDLSNAITLIRIEHTTPFPPGFRKEVEKQLTQAGSKSHCIQLLLKPKQVSHAIKNVLQTVDIPTQIRSWMHQQSVGDDVLETFQKIVNHAN